jgi:hypothetical protein
MGTESESRPDFVELRRTVHEIFYREGKNMNFKPYIAAPETAEKIAEWLRTRDGIAIWRSVDFSRVGQTVTTPVNTSDGKPFPKPVIWVRDTPACIITDPADVLISRDVEVKRLYAGVRAGDGGLDLRYTDGASHHIRAAVANAGEGAYHVFDPETQETVVMKPSSPLPLLDFLDARETLDIHLVKAALQEKL